MSEANEPIKIPNMMPKEIVAHLDKYIIGQDEAKKSIAIAIRNRYRRSRLPKEMQEEISPSNIIMMGPTGVGKTEIVRRASKILGTPFVKVEATKFTEVGYVGRDVESMVRDLVEASIRLVRAEKIKAVQGEAQKLATERLIDILVPSKKKQRSGNNPFEMLFGAQQQSDSAADAEEERRRNDQKVIFKEKLRRHEFDDQVIEIEVEEKHMTNDMLSATGMDQVMDNMNDMMKNIMPTKKKKKRVTVTEARDILAEEEAEKLIDEDLVAQEAIALAENHGIIFIDEIDKIAETNVNGGGAGVSREGVQRDILPIVEGSVVKTKYGPIKTDHILFIAAGAFHVSKPEDLIPELQGRFPYKVQLHSLDKYDFVRILTETEHSLPEKYEALLAVDDTALTFTEDGLEAIAEYAYELNENEEDLGARRLVSVMEKALLDTLYEAGGSHQEIVVDEAFVKNVCKLNIIENQLDKYIL
ncbi:MAG: ATP-dependent protease ATPase subunit HslU [Peptococcaceae bacterium]|nr:ATP-dependent protease ATPase subunit HslU [Peptococcaceae bacterium]